MVWSILPAQLTIYSSSTRETAPKNIDEYTHWSTKVILIWQKSNALPSAYSFAIRFNSSPTVAAYARQWTGPTLVQVMACRLFDAKPLPETMLAYRQLHSWEQIQWNLNRNSIISIQENGFGNVVCQNGGHLVRGRWVKPGLRRSLKGCQTLRCLITSFFLWMLQ